MSIRHECEHPCQEQLPCHNFVKSFDTSRKGVGATDNRSGTFHDRPAESRKGTRTTDNRPETSNNRSDAVNKRVMINGNRAGNLNICPKAARKRVVTADKRVGRAGNRTVAFANLDERDARIVARRLYNVI